MRLFDNVCLYDRGGRSGVVDGDDDRPTVATEDFEAGSAPGYDSPTAFVGWADDPTEPPASEVRHRIDGYDARFFDIGCGYLQSWPADHRSNHESAWPCCDDELRGDEKHD